MRDGAASLVRKLWQYCNVLRDDGLSYPDYVEQLTYLLFLKMSDEQRSGPVPAGLDWQSLVQMDAQAMHRQYTKVLSELGSREGMFGLIFRNAKNKIRDPAKLRLLVVDLIGQTEWSGLSADVKGDAYEGLLEKNARDTKSGAGQYFTPRPLIDAIVECVEPTTDDTVCDPACGTGGFLIAAYQHAVRRDPQEGRRHRGGGSMVRGVELVEEVARLATMNLLLHGVAGRDDVEVPITCKDSLQETPSTQASVVMTNPPFGTKGTVTYSDGRRTQRADDQLTVVRPDFWAQTANKQLNFLQHVAVLLAPGGRAAIVVPDNVLFEAGTAAIVRRRLLESFDVHTLLRLPGGLFYAQGVRANVLFFDRPQTQVKTAVPSGLWVYDLRAENKFSLKTKPLQRADLDEFVGVYGGRDRAGRSRTNETEVGCQRWRSFDRNEILGSEDCSFDLSWIEQDKTEEATGLVRLEEISRLISEDLQRALGHVSQVLAAGPKPSAGD